MSPMFPSRHAAAVTKSDTTPLFNVTQRLYVGGTGNVTVKMASGQLCTFLGVPAGAVLDIGVTHVMEATTATNIVAMF